MPSLKDIRARIQTTKNTQQITRAVKMVSSAKLRRAQHHITNLRPYANRVQQVIKNMAATQRISHALMDERAEETNILMITFTSDRGLCGAFNNAVNRTAWEFFNKQKAVGKNIDVVTVGRKSSDFFKKRGVLAKEQLAALERTVSLGLAQEMGEGLAKDFLENKYDAIYIVYNEFRSALSQTPRAERVLPLDVSTTDNMDSVAGEFSKDILFEPPAEQIINDLLQRHLSYQIYRCMYESVASEHGARMTAMENATKNAGEMIRILTLTYNKLRQASITTELIEITSGAEALKG